MTNQIEKLIQKSGLDDTKALSLREQFSEFAAIANEWKTKADEIQVTSIEHREEMKLAREGRLFLKQKRVEVEKTRKKLKESSLKEGRAIDGIAKALKSLIEPIEQNLQEKEDYVKNIEEQRIRNLRAERHEVLKDYIDYIEDTLDLGTLSEENFKLILAGAKAQKQEAEIEAKEREKEAVKIRQELTENNHIKSPFDEVTDNTTPIEETTDKEKILSFIKQLEQIDYPEVSTQAYEDLVNEANMHIATAIRTMREYIKTDE